jgi:hypothetical protein
MVDSQQQPTAENGSLVLVKPMTAENGNVQYSQHCHSAAPPRLEGPEGGAKEGQGHRNDDAGTADLHPLPRRDVGHDALAHRVGVPVSLDLQQQIFNLRNTQLV